MKVILVIVIVLIVFSIYWFEDRPRFKELKKNIQKRKFWNELNDLQIAILTMSPSETNAIFYRIIEFNEKWQKVYGGSKDCENRIHDLIRMYNDAVKIFSHTSKNQ